MLHSVAIIVLTLLTQIGGLAWLFALAARRRWLAFLVLYAAFSVASVWVAPVFGRVALPCVGGALSLQTPLYCALNRHYVAPELKAVLLDHARAMADAHPGTETRVLDANFPYFDGFPLLPHLSHYDGQKADLAFYYRDETGYLPGRARSPLGYFAFEDGPTACKQAWPSLRWDLDWLQPLWPRWEVEPARMRTALASLTADPRVRRIFLEPHLVESLGVAHPKIRFQGCGAARHDDHIHFEV